MATNYLNTLNNSISINSASISNASSKDALLLLSKRNSEDLNNLADYINQILVPGLSSVASKPAYPYDAVESGISGLTLITYPEEQGNDQFNSELFWKPGATPETGRPCTIKESFDYLLSNMIDRVVEIRESLVNLDPLWDQIRCNRKDLLRLSKDTFGLKYTFNCDDSPTKTYALGEHVYQLIAQLTNNPNNVGNELDTGSSDYPTLTLNLPNTAVATESLRGISEIASVVEIAQAASLADSTSNAELVVTSDRLDLALSSDDANGNLQGNAVNTLRNRIKDIADEQIDLADIGRLNNVSETGAVNGDTLVYTDGSWSPSSPASTSLLGSFTVQPTVGDLTGLVTKNYQTVAFSKNDDSNVRVQSYDIFGLNNQYLFTEDREFKGNDSASLRQKKIPFVLRLAPDRNGIAYNTTSLLLGNAIVNAGLGSSSYLAEVLSTGEVGGNQARCTYQDENSQQHVINPNKVLGICRSDIEYGSTWLESSNGTITGNVEAGFESFMVSGNDITIQEHGCSKLMLLGPTKIGDSVYLCPARILEMLGINNGLGICISETFINTSIISLTGAAIPINDSIFDIMLSNPSDFYITQSNKTEMLSKQIGLITNKYNNNPNLDHTNLNDNKVSVLCYNLVESTYNITNELVSALDGVIDQGTQQDAFNSLMADVCELSLPLVKLTL